MPDEPTQPQKLDIGSFPKTQGVIKLKVEKLKRMTLGIRF